jgi:hypothetical protein
MLYRPIFPAIANGQLAPMLLFLLISAFWLHQQGHRFAAGLVLALQIAKPNLTVFFVPLLVLILLVRRDLRTLSGLAVGGLGLMAVSWLALPGWALQWLTAAGKTRASSITPTIWGLTHDLVGEPSWRTLAILAVALVLIGTSISIWQQRRQNWLFSLGLALGVSVFATPYLWAYEQLVLFFPAMIGLYWGTSSKCCWEPLWAAGWTAIVVGLSWALVFVAMKRGIDTWSAFVTVGIIVYFVTAWYAGMRNRRANQEIEV